MPESIHHIQNKGSLCSAGHLKLVLTVSVSISPLCPLPLPFPLPPPSLYTWEQLLWFEYLAAVSYIIQ